jgi:hypothetical protein
MMSKETLFYKFINDVYNETYGLKNIIWNPCYVHPMPTYACDIAEYYGILKNGQLTLKGLWMRWYINNKHKSSRKRYIRRLMSGHGNR